MIAPTAEAPYTLRHLEQMLGLSRGVVAGLIGAGYVSPARGPRNELRFSFQDVVLLRTAVELKDARIPPGRLLRSLRQLRERLPAEMPLSGLRITAIGRDVAVREGSAQWAAHSGQLLMDFGVGGDESSVTFLNPVASRPSAGEEPDVGAVAPGSTVPLRAGAMSAGGTLHRPVPADAQSWYDLAEAAESTDPTAAEAAYRRALALAPDHVHAYVNLGALLCERGRCREAVALYEQAAFRVPDSPLVHFNAGIALEDQHRDTEALACYERCLVLAPDMADAHYNAARLYDKTGDRQGALRHYSAYRRLQRSHAPQE